MRQIANRSKVSKAVQLSIFDILSNGRTSATFHSASKHQNLTICLSSLSVQEEEHFDIARQSKSALDQMN